MTAVSNKSPGVAYDLLRSISTPETPREVDGAAGCGVFKERLVKKLKRAVLGFPDNPAIDEGRELRGGQPCVTEPFGARAC